MRYTWEHNYILILEKSIEIGLPDAFRSDLTKHDKATLSKDNPQYFLWIPRETGTELISQDDMLRYPEQCYAHIKWFMDNNQTCRYFAVYNGKIEERTKEDMNDLLATLSSVAQTKEN